MKSTEVISKNQILYLSIKALRLCDKRLIEHGERVAFIANNIARYVYKNNEINFEKLITLSIFHDIGAYKTEEIDKMLNFESDDVWPHSIYGYLFLKYFTPVKQYSKALLFHHLDYYHLSKLDFDFKDYSSLIHLSDTVDILINNDIDKNKIIKKLNKNAFNPKHIIALDALINETSIYEDLRSRAYLCSINDIINTLDISTKESIEYLKMLIYTIDFRSNYTVVHSITTTSISTFLAKNLNYDKKEVEKLYFASLIHDIGKMAIPEDILEYSGKLNESQMSIMKNHVLHTKKIITGVFPQEVCDIACRHHEKLDGSGYPLGLKAEDLSTSDRIIAIADITSALMSKRSYKDIYSKEKTLSILDKMVNNNQIDKDIVSVIHNKYEELEKVIDENSKPILDLYNNLKSEYNKITQKVMMHSYNY